MLMQNNPRDTWPQEVYNHPHINAATLKNASDKISPDVIQLIELHHELPDGDGFPRGVSSNNIPILAAIIIVAELFCTKILDADFDPNQKEVLIKYFEKRFTSGVFRLAREALVKAINKR